MSLECILTDEEIDLHRAKQNELNSLSWDHGVRRLGFGYVPDFPFTNENLSGHRKALRPLLCGKKVLAICGGGDFSISAIAAGAEELLAIDKNPAACYLAELKAASLSCLTYNQFKRAKFAERKTYGVLRDMLSDEAQDYFDGKIGAVKGRFSRMHLAWGLRRSAGNIPYLQGDEEYKLARKALAGFSYRIGDFSGVVEEEERDTDVAYISNIYRRGWMDRTDRSRLAEAISTNSADEAVVLAASHLELSTGKDSHLKYCLFDPFGQVGFEPLEPPLDLTGSILPRCAFHRIVALRKSRIIGGVL